jgi:mRNA-degrading endonuclease RelE of RelBE toxin-antitoxin system
MEKLLKFLSKLQSKEREMAEKAIIAIRSGSLDGYNVMKLKGYSDIYRLRIQGIRIIFKKDGELVFILDIGRRSEKTYRDF